MFAQLAPWLKTARNALLDLLFPPRCVACRRSGNWFCAACQAQIQPIRPPLCAHCGRPSTRTPCPFCHKQPLAMNGTRAVAFFDHPLRQAIHALKYEQRTELAAPLGDLLSDYLRAHPLPADALIAVPLHPTRERERGYNQAALLAQAIHTRLGLPVWTDALTRVRATRTQTELNAAERRTNVAEAFAATARVAGAHLILVDDVLTTGATMNACAVALRECGAQTVWGVALARPRLD